MWNPEFKHHLKDRFINKIFLQFIKVSTMFQCLYLAAKKIKVICDFILMELSSSKMGWYFRHFLWCQGVLSCHIIYQIFKSIPPTILWDPLDKILYSSPFEFQPCQQRLTHVNLYQLSTNLTKPPSSLHHGPVF
jgi:hypothetical protein